LRRSEERKELAVSVVRSGVNLADARGNPPSPAADFSSSPVVADAASVKDYQIPSDSTRATRTAVESRVLPSRRPPAREGGAASGHSRRGPCSPPRQPRPNRCSAAHSTRRAGRLGGATASHEQCGGGVRGPSRWAGCWAGGGSRRLGWGAL
jgi:hypothetical protein